jgi:hypothetical protein
VTNRESWWRAELRPTPRPGAYSVPSSWDQMNKKPATYNFKTDGRKHDPVIRMKKGDYLLPGAYNFEDMQHR